MRSADVYLGDRLAGRIAERPGGGSAFTYDPAYLAGGEPISFALPLRAEPYENPGLPSFFDGLLPEGWYLEMVCRQLQIDPEDRFGLLLATCRDCVGAVSVIPSGEPEAADA